MTPAPAPEPARYLRPARILLLIAACALGLAFIARNKGGPWTNDILAYWSYARVMWNGGNPYDYNHVVALQAEYGLPTTSYTPLHYPPWALPLILPFGLLEFSTSQVAWLLFQVGLVVFCSQRIWHLYGGSPQHKWLAWFISFTFMPTFSSLALTGQITPLMLLGATMFLHWVDRPSRGWLAGAFTILLAIKPQAFYLFFIVLLFWVITKHRWNTLVGLGVGVLSGSLAAMLIQPSIFSQYLEAVVSHPPAGGATPTIGYFARLLFAPQAFALQWIGPALGVTWLLFYWARCRKAWDWRRHLPVVLCVSAITSFYTFTYDHIVLLIPAIALLLLAFRSHQRTAGLALAAAYILTNLAYFILHLRLDDSWFLWFPVAILALYLAARRLTPQPGPVLAPEANP